MDSMTMKQQSIEKNSFKYKDLVNCLGIGQVHKQLSFPMMPSGKDKFLKIPIPSWLQLTLDIMGIFNVYSS